MLTQTKRDYLKVKAIVTELNAEIENITIRYIKEHNITNSNGKIPKYIWCIEDEDLFEKSSTEVDKIITSSGLGSLLLYYETILSAIEEQMIDEGLSILGVKELKNIISKDLTAKHQLVNLILTMPA